MSTLYDFNTDLPDHLYEDINFGNMISDDCEPDYFHEYLEDVSLAGPLSRCDSIDSSIISSDNQIQNNRLDNDEKHASEKKNQFPFHIKLFNLLELSDQTVVSWLSNGRAFRVLDMDKFVTDILPQYFNRKCSIILVICLLIEFS